MLEKIIKIEFTLTEFDVDVFNKTIDGSVYALVDLKS
jgi:hypothetical protein